jgi:hypothetical protein
VGGEFFFDPQPADAPRNLVLIAGGVGINPLLSILRHSADLHRERANKGSGYEIGTIKLFYSAKNTSELLFKVKRECLFTVCCEQTRDGYYLSRNISLGSGFSAQVHTKGWAGVNHGQMKVNQHVLSRIVKTANVEDAPS